jgi:hypothetical protein
MTLCARAGGSEKLSGEVGIEGLWHSEHTTASHQVLSSQWNGQQCQCSRSAAQLVADDAGVLSLLCHTCVVVCTACIGQRALHTLRLCSTADETLILLLLLDSAECRKRKLWLED